MLQILLVALPILVLISSILLQLRLSALGLAPVEFELPDLPDLPDADDRLANVRYEKVGENEQLLYPESIAHVPEGCSFVSLGDGTISRLCDGFSSIEPLLRTGGGSVDNGEEANNADNGLPDWSACGKGGPADANDMEEKCGRPLGLLMTDRSSVDPDFAASSSSSSRGEIISEDEKVLIVADAYEGLLMVTGLHGRPEEARKRVLATRAKSDPPDYRFKLLNAVVQTPRDGDLYFTETSREFHRRRIFHAALSAPTGRLLRYRREGGGEAEVVAEGVYMANGLAISHDGGSLLIVSGVSVLRYDLARGEMSERPFVSAMPGTGDNIVAMGELPDGERRECYWLGLGGKYAKPFSLLKFLSDKPRLSSFLLAVVPYRKLIDLIPKWTALAVYDEEGELLETLIDHGEVDENGKRAISVPWISEVVPEGDYLYLLSWYNPFLARIKRSSIGVKES